MEIKDNHFTLEMLDQSDPREEEFFREMNLLLKKPEDKKISKQNTWNTAEFKSRLSSEQEIMRYRTDNSVVASKKKDLKEALLEGQIREVEFEDKTSHYNLSANS